MKKWFTRVATFAFLAAFTGVAGVYSVSAQRPVLRELLNRMDTHNKGLTTLRAKITEVKTNAQLGVSDTRVGTVIYGKRPGKDALARIDWQKPEESMAIIDGKYQLYQPAAKLMLTGSTKDAGKGPKGTSAFAFMNMSKAQLNANYTVVLLGENVTLSSGVRTWHLGMTPNAKTNYKSAELWVDADGMPHQTKIVENNDDTATYLLANIEKNASLKTSNFQITPAPGTKVQKS